MRKNKTETKRTTTSKLSTTTKKRDGRLTMSEYIHTREFRLLVSQYCRRITKAKTFYMSCHEVQLLHQHLTYSSGESKSSCRKAFLSPMPVPNRMKHKELCPSNPEASSCHLHQLQNHCGIQFQPSSSISS
ncbi:hypothetical protein PanWU01x14_041860 [Parasponia andersonii]|uniref:Uncharacterized protein n=1 Tax=Parasponia andersonii TaxID=3476 RepID=A0A2P5DQL2_PARAD|nr:hypothetical protein PanWU01x14_041860 [Parasponia andersonii]